ncbi:hypothetical protein E3E35_09215 [Thermococcus sp. GR7]|uniref:hypothetical protein n=1 Tax=unclassified Thermococcus TaxID=2627626 RepID=UPI00142FD03D|nr:MULTISPECIES: hypothetical protein [unclassified Thermococcus]NJE47571.1 hypothetical protein [Thermococcus sp. GR7]NJE79337.1 hypothetical protein [Thermococcus sp. GR4]NJF22473.1 hypothetical protein [Thermococcus sp. GR5]
MVRDGTTEYACIGPLAREIIMTKLQQAVLHRNTVQPFFRENQKNGYLELVIPTNCLSPLEKYVLEGAGYPKKPVRVGDGIIRAFILNVRYIEQNDPELSKEIINIYNKRLEESCVGPCYKYGDNYL